MPYMPDSFCWTWQHQHEDKERFNTIRPSKVDVDWSLHDGNAGGWGINVSSPKEDLALIGLIMYCKQLDQ